MRFTLYTKPCCPLCDDAMEVVRLVQKQIPFELDVVDISENPQLWERYQDLIPVLTLGDEDLFYGKVSAHRLKQIVRTAQKNQRGDKVSILPPRYKAFLSRLRGLLADQRSSSDKRP